jgi:hypothetical protein
MVTMLSAGVLLRPDLQGLPTPATAGVMASIVGPWGPLFISIGLLISLALLVLAALAAQAALWALVTGALTV